VDRKLVASANISIAEFLGGRRQYFTLILIRTGIHLSKLVSDGR